jgi:hypothetical protein
VFTCVDGRYCELTAQGDTNAKNAGTRVQTWKRGGADPIWDAEFVTDVDNTTSKSIPRQGSPIGCLFVYPSTRSIEVAVMDANADGHVLGKACISLPVRELPLPEGAPVTTVPDLRALESQYSGGGEVVVTLEVEEEGVSGATVRMVLLFETLVTEELMCFEETHKWSLRSQMKREVLLSKQGRGGILTVVVQGARGLAAADLNGLSDPYVVIKQIAHSGDVIHEERSPTVEQTLDPDWDFLTHLEIGPFTSGLDLTVMDWDRAAVDDELGSAYLSIEYLQQFHEETEVVHALSTPQTFTGGASRQHGRLRMRFKFTTFTVDSEDTAENPERIEQTLQRTRSTVARTASVRHIRKAKKKSVASCCSSAPPTHGVKASMARKRVLTQDHLAGNEYIDPEHRDDFFDRVMKTAGETYSVVGTGEHGQPLVEKLLEMRLIVLARRDILPHISGIQITTEATGFGGVIGNKGGIIAKMDYRGTSLCFVGSHLAAHEGRKHCNERNAMAETVQRNGRLGNTQVDLGNQFSHVFWAGDLNYRQEMRSWWSDPQAYEAGAKADTPHVQKLDQIKELIANADYAALRANDELVREMEAGRVMAGFQDSLHWETDVGLHGLMPTFKMKRGRRYAYTAQRVPSYCDRVLWRSAPGETQCIDLDKFQVVPNLATSDHKAVMARFHLSIPRSIMRMCDDYRLKNAGQPEKYATLRLSDIAVHGLAAEAGLRRRRLQVAFGFGKAGTANTLLRDGELSAFYCNFSHEGASGSRWLCDDVGIIRSTVPSIDMFLLSIEAPTPTSEKMSKGLEAAEEGCTLHVRNIRDCDSLEKFRVLLGDYGHVVSANIRKKMDEKTGVDQSWAFVVMASAAEAALVLATRIPPLVISPYSKKEARSSKGSASRVHYSPSLTVRVGSVRLNWHSPFPPRISIYLHAHVRRCTQVDKAPSSPRQTGGSRPGAQSLQKSKHPAACSDLSLYTRIRAWLQSRSPACDLCARLVLVCHVCCSPVSREHEGARARQGRARGRHGAGLRPAGIPSTERRGHGATAAPRVAGCAPVGAAGGGAPCRETGWVLHSPVPNPAVTERRWKPGVREWSPGALRGHGERTAHYGS